MKCQNCGKEKDKLYWNGTLKICGSDCAINFLLHELTKIKAKVKKLSNK